MKKENDECLNKPLKIEEKKELGDKNFIWRKLETLVRYTKK